MAICYKCKHFMNAEPTGPRCDIWYNHFCKASPLKKFTNPVTGMEETNTDTGFEHCREVNKGDCPKYEEN